MAGKYSKPTTYYQRSVDQAQTKFNLVEAAKEKLNVKTAFEEARWEVTEPQEPQNGKDLEVLDASYRVMTAPTQKPSRPRARKIAYNASTETLVIRFRSGAWVGYDDISVEVWNGLKSSPSTNDFINGSPDIGPGCSWYTFDPANFPPETRVLFNA
jgi:hypothetical protein